MSCSIQVRSLTVWAFLVCWFFPTKNFSHQILFFHHKSTSHSEKLNSYSPALPAAPAIKAEFLAAYPPILSPTTNCCPPLTKPLQKHKTLRNDHEPHKETPKPDIQKHHFYFTLTSFYIMSTSLPITAIAVLHRAGD